jgi:AmpD protein
VYTARDWLDFLKLSAHALIHPNGEIEICRPPDAGAYHARGHNTDSLGIEFLVAGVHDYGTFLETIKTDWCTPEQYKAGAELVNQWRFDFDIGMIVRHSDISPGRKVDPGTGFKWREFMERLK